MNIEVLARRAWVSATFAAALCLHSALPAQAAADSIQSSSDVLAEHALAQQGLAIALASNVLQSHLLYVSAALGYEGGSGGNYDGSCNALDSTDPQAGGIEASAPTPPPNTIPPLVHVTLFYDGACTRKYMVADVALQDSGLHNNTRTDSVTNLVTQYYAVDGVTPLVSLTSTASATISQTSLSLHGLGTLVGPSGHAITASLGLVCASGASTSTTNTLLCAGGVTQDFHTLNTAIGSVSPLTLSIPVSGNELSFLSTTPAAFRSGAVDSLTLNYTDSTDSALAISGGTDYGSDNVGGVAGSFSLFPPPPTEWNSNDSAHDAHFQISVVSPTTRNLTLSITRISNGVTRASANLDQSGTGTITFSDGSSAEVRGWTIGDGLPDRIFANGFEVQP